MIRKLLRNLEIICEVFLIKEIRQLNYEPTVLIYIYSVSPTIDTAIISRFFPQFFFLNEMHFAFQFRAKVIDTKYCKQLEGVTKKISLATACIDGAVWPCKLQGWVAHKLHLLCWSIKLLFNICSTWDLYLFTKQ